MVPDRRQPGLAARGAGSWRQPERRVLIRDQGERAGDDAVVPAENASTKLNMPRDRSASRT
jgi:hypothetical protein